MRRFLGRFHPYIGLRQMMMSLRWPTTRRLGWRLIFMRGHRPNLAWAEALEYGMVGINTGMISTPVAPFGASKNRESAEKDRVTALKNTSKSSISVWVG